MRHILGVVTALLLCGVSTAQQPDEPATGISVSSVELRGKISSVHVARGQRMPFLEIEENGKTTKVYLGSMRYLMQNDFNPKAGEQVEVKGFRRDGDLVAIRVTLTSRNKTLRLRDENGQPLWQSGWRGGYRGGRGRRQQEPRQ